MTPTLEKIRRLEQYIAAADSAAVDPVLGMTIDKLLDRETAHTGELKTRLEDQLAEFEKKHALSSAEFYTRYQKGEMGDKTDFVEWASTVEMLKNAEKRLALLMQEPLR